MVTIDGGDFLKFMKELKNAYDDITHMFFNIGVEGKNMMESLGENAVYI